MARFFHLLPCLPMLLLLLLLLVAADGLRLTAITNRRLFISSIGSSAATVAVVAAGKPSEAAAVADPPPLLRLTRAELSKKLARIPVFYVASNGGGVAVSEGGEGFFYLRKADAEAAAVKAAAAAKAAEAPAPRGVELAFLNDVYFALVLKSAKLEMFPKNTIVGATVFEGNGEAPFQVVTDSASSRQDGEGVPLFFIERIALKGADPTQLNSMQKPLFLSENDCRRAWSDLLETQKKREAGVLQQATKGLSFVTVKPPSDDAPQSSIGDQPAIVKLELGKVLSAMQRGKAEMAGLPETEDMRVLEFFPSADAIEDARELYVDSRVMR